MADLHKAGGQHMLQKAAAEIVEGNDERTEDILNRFQGLSEPKRLFQGPIRDSRIFIIPKTEKPPKPAKSLERLYTTD